MSFPFNLYAVVFASSFLAAAGSMLLWRRWGYRTGLVDDPGHRKIHDKPIALTGGFAVLTGIMVPVLCAAVAFKLGWFGSGPAANGPGIAGDFAGWLGFGLTRRGSQVAVILLGALAMVVLGWLDDMWELSPAMKFGGQLLVATAVAAAGVRITLFVPAPLVNYLVTILWILTLTNALNFMDNMNGLCGGLGLIGTWCFAWGAAVQGQYLVALLAFTTSGALLGFLPFNFPKASVFLGDAGSHLVGYLLAVMAILPHFYSSQNPHALAVLKPLVILAVPLLDLICVVIIRWRKNQPFYVGDTNHLSHRLVRRGWSKTGAVLVIWLMAALAGALAFVAL